MNEVRRFDRGLDDVKLAREIVAGHEHEFPEFITDFDIILGRSDGEPALFVLYKTVGEDEGWPSPEWAARADAYRKIDDIVLPELINALVDRFPFSFLVPDSQWGKFPG